MTLNIVIIGRPNVGKSTLFNKMVGKNHSITGCISGTTRDRRIEETYFDECCFNIVDTAGLEKLDKSQLTKKIQEQTWIAIQKSNIILFMIDGIIGIMPYDIIISNCIRKTNKPIIVIINKIDYKKTSDNFYEIWKLGLGDPILISSEHGIGIDVLWEKILKISKKKNVSEKINENDFLRKDEFNNQKIIHISFIGRPNVGKSTLINTILKEERLIVDSQEGITRDSISIETVWNDQKVKLYDTAGLRRKTHIKNKIEKDSIFDTINTINLSEIVILVLDSSSSFEKRDLQIANLVIREGRALIIAINKWDMIKNKKEEFKKIYCRLQNTLSQVKGIKVIPVSGLYGIGLNILIENIKTIYNLWNCRLSTGVLNRWLKTMKKDHDPKILNSYFKIKYITQVKERPPCFMISSSKINSFSKSYLRYLTNNLRKDFLLPGIPIRFVVKKNKNPFKKDLTVRKNYK